MIRTETFAHACQLGLEGIVSKDRTRPYRSGPNPDAPGVRRFEEET